MSDIDTGVVDSLKALDPDGRLEKRTNSRHLGMCALCQKQTRRIGRYGALTVRSACTKVYQMLAATMQAGAAEAADVRAAE